MTARHAVLPIGAVLVLALGVYLFIEVRAQPAPPNITRKSQPSHLAENEAQATPPPSRDPAVPAPPATPPVAGRRHVFRDPTMTALAVAPASPATREVAMGSATSDTDATLAPGPRLDAIMDEANKAYDRGDFEDAKQVASRVLARFPGNVRMLRIMVSASCIDGDAPVAQAHYARLPPVDQEQMKLRCARYGVAFP